MKFLSPLFLAALSFIATETLLLNLANAQTLPEVPMSSSSEPAVVIEPTPDPTGAPAEVIVEPTASSVVDAANEPGVDTVVDTNTPTQIQKLERKRTLARTWAPLCSDGTQSHGICPFADMTIFSGMLCLSGEVERCNDVKNAQGPDGRWWRSPEAIENDNLNSFSRDQSKGALAYLVATKDVAAAIRWQTYLDANDQKMCTKSTDNRCKITSGSSRLFGAVWEYLGLKPAKWMNRGKWISNFYDQIEASVQPDNFPMHLNALNAYIRLEIERRGGPKVDSVDQKVMKILVKRQPDNPFFLMLRKGPTEEVARLIIERCPDQKPAFERLDWAWQRSMDDKPWLHSSGHECIFIVNMFERELTFRK